MGYFTVSALIRDYLQHNSLCPVTRKQSAYHLKKIVEIFGRRKAEIIDSSDLSKFVEKELERGLAMSTISTRVRIFKAVVHWGIRTGRIGTCQIDSFRLSKIKTRRIAPPDYSELKAMLKVCESHIERLLRLGWQLGPRIGPSELFALRWDNVDFELGTIQMPNACKGANCESRCLPVPASLLDRLKQWRQEDKSEWVINWKGRDVKHVNKAFDSARKKAGIKRKFTPYSLRHAFATQALANGAPLKGVCAVMGHSSPRMVLEVYQHINFELLKDTLKKIKAI